MAEHTPGPWRWDKCDGWAILVSAPVWDAQPWNPEMTGQIADDGSAAGEYPVVLDPDSSNGRLIAAAPDLLAALEYILPTMPCNVLTDKVNGLMECDPARCRRERIKAAIAKAREDSHAVE